MKTALIALALSVTPAFATEDPQSDVKELRFSFAAKIQRENTKDEVKSNIEINFEETGSILLGQTEVRLTPTKKGDKQEMHFEVYDLDLEKIVYRSIVPMQFSHKLSLHAEVPPGESSIRMVLVELAKL